MMASSDEVTAWMAADPDPDDQQELRDLAEQAESDPGALAELQDRFAGTLEFGTAGLRGAMAAGPNRMNRAVVRRAARGLIDYLNSHVETPVVVIGNDARHHSREFAEDTAAIVTAAGGQAWLLPDRSPTPLLAYAVRHLGADAGVMVTASHNPARDNGYKVYLGGRLVDDHESGVQIVAPQDAAIAACIAAAPAANQIPLAGDWGDLGPDLLDSYLAAVAGDGSGPGSAPIRIVHTAMHGVGSAPALAALARAGFSDVHPVPAQQKPDPDFPTVAFPNPEEPGAIDLALELACQVEADVVIANDPDADRCAVAVNDPRAGWRMLHGDELGAVLGEDAAGRIQQSEDAVRTEVVGRSGDTAGQSGCAAGSGTASRPGAVPAQAQTPAAVLVNSIVSSRQLEAIAASHGLPHARTLTGFKWMGRVPDLAYAYEEAIGYCVRPDLVRDKDGLSTAVAVARLVARLKAEGRTLNDLLDDLARCHGLYLTSQLSVRFADLSEIPRTMERLRTAPPTALAGSPVTAVADLAEGYDSLPPTEGVFLLTQDNDRVIVRPSGTEPKIKCYLEVVRPVAPDASFAQLTGVRQLAEDRLAVITVEMNTTLFS